MKFEEEKLTVRRKYFNSFRQIKETEWLFFFEVKVTPSVLKSEIPVHLESSCEWFLVRIVVGKGGKIPPLFIFYNETIDHDILDGIDDLLFTIG